MTTSTGRQRSAGGSATLSAGWVMPPRLPTDEYLCAKRPAFDSVGGIANAATEVLLSSGCVRVSNLARNAGLGIRQFERRFRYEIGIPPKLYARIVRFEAALRRKAAAPETRWTDIAHALGYHDQMHMVHDFNRLSGDSPTAIGSQLDMFVQPEVVFSPTSVQLKGEINDALPRKRDQKRH